MEKFAKKYPKTHKFIKYSGNALQVAHQAYNMAKVVASIVNSEKKYKDTAISIAPDSASSTGVCLTEIAQGDTDTTRNGDSIAIKSLQLELHRTFDPTVPNEVIRTLLVREYDNAEGTAPLITEVLDSCSTLALRNLNYPKRFKILMDKSVSNHTTKSQALLSKYKKFNMMKDKKGNPTVSQKVTWIGNDANDYGRGHLWLFVIGNVATASTLSAVTGNARIRYYDN